MAKARINPFRYVARAEGYDVYFRDEKKPRGFVWMDSQARWDCRSIRPTGLTLRPMPTRDKAANALKLAQDAAIPLNLGGTDA